MSEPIRLSPKSLLVLKLIAGGHSYAQIIEGNPELNYHDIFFAAEEAVWLDEKVGSLSAKGTMQSRPGEMSAMERAKQKYPNAYAPWSESDDAKLAAAR
jgi:hypothetical protein